MSIFFLFIKTWAIGIAIAAPVGPIGILCIRKTLELGLIGAISVGIGAALADSMYGLIGGLGLTSIHLFFISQATIIKIGGGIFLIYLGIKEFKMPSSVPSIIQSSAKNTLKLISQTFFLTLTNPMTILSFVGIFASIGGLNVTIAQSFWIVLGVFAGSISWWIILGKVTLWTKGHLSATTLNRIRFLSGAILIGFGVWAILHSVLKTGV